MSGYSNDNGKKIFVRVRYNHVNKYVFLDQLCAENFLDEVKKAFHINANTIKVQLFDNVGANIPIDYFTDIVCQYQSSASFFIHVQIVEADMDALIVSVKELEEFLIQEDAGKFLDLRHETLSKKEMSGLMRYVGVFAERRFGLSPTRIQKEELARAIVGLFPKIQLETLVNSNDGGKLSIQLRNKRYGTKKGERSDVNANPSLNGEDATNAIEILKSMPVAESTMDEFKRLLNSTLEYRRTKLKSEEELNLQEYFPYFFVSTELISYDFSLRFQSADLSSLENWWEQYSARTTCVLKSHNKQTYHSMWPNAINELLIFLKLLPAKARADNLCSVHAFKKAVTKLIVFRKTGTVIEKMVEKNNDHPYIIAVGPSQSEITHFYVDVEKQLMNVPPHFSIGQTFDLFVKIHKVFEMKCDPNLELLFKFCEHFIYQIDCTRGNAKKKKYTPTTNVKTLYNLLTEENHVQMCHFCSGKSH